jgi:hypothetical protein
MLLLGSASHWRPPVPVLDQHGPPPRTEDGPGWAGPEWGRAGPGWAGPGRAGPIGCGRAGPSLGQVRAEGSAGSGSLPSGPNQSKILGNQRAPLPRVTLPRSRRPGQSEAARPIRLRVGPGSVANALASPAAVALGNNGCCPHPLAAATAPVAARR